MFNQSAAKDDGTGTMRPQGNGVDGDNVRNDIEGYMSWDISAQGILQRVKVKHVA
jgi:hypothetical protein